MTLVPLDRLPPDPEGLARRADARMVLASYEEFLAAPAFVHRVDVAVLTKIATDEGMPVRERRRAAEVLGRLRLQAMEALATLSGVREQVLKSLGIAPAGGAPSVSVTQINAPLHVEVVREDDWRGGDGGVG